MLQALLGNHKLSTITGGLLGTLIAFNGGTIPTLRDALIGVAIAALGRWIKEPAVRM